MVMSDNMGVFRKTCACSFFGAVVIASIITYQTSLGGYLRTSIDYWTMANDTLWSLESIFITESFSFETSNQDKDEKDDLKQTGRIHLEDTTRVYAVTHLRNTALAKGANKTLMMSTIIPHMLSGSKSHSHEIDFHDSKFNPQINSTSRVIIYAKLRTGSSFASEVFNKNPDFFYTFEPLTFATAQDRHNNSSEWLERILNCEFQDLWRQAWFNPIHKTESLPGWKRKILCYKYNQSDECARAPVSEIERNCTMFPARAIKEIHVKEVEHLRPLMDEGTKVIHLTRDPRAVINSRLHMVPLEKQVEYVKNIKWFTKMSKKYCDGLVRDITHIRDVYRNNNTMKYSNISSSDSNLSTVLNGDSTNEVNGTDKHTDNTNSIPYLLMRYEDLVQNPVENIEKIYSHISLSPHEAVYKWARDLVDLNKGQIGGKLLRKESTFNTFRLHPTESVSHWRLTLPWDLVSSIQDVCSPAMDLLGYRRVDSQQDMMGGTEGVVLETELQCLYHNC